MFPTDDDLASSSLHGSQFYMPSAFDITGGFQMNPLSAHPPRTPRASTVLAHPTASAAAENDLSYSHLSATSIGTHYGMHESAASSGSGHEVPGSSADASACAAREAADVVQVPDANEDGDVVSEFDEADERVKATEKNIAPYQVWRDILATSDGRDKAFKAMQYVMRVYLLLHTRLLFRSSAGAWQRALVRRLESARAGFSFTRKMLILFNWLSPLHIILSQKAVPYASPSDLKPPPPSSCSPTSLTGKLLSHPIFQALLAAPPPVLLDLVNGLADDVATLARLGIAGPRLGTRAARFADWCWLLGTLANLVQNGIEVGIVEGLQREVENRAYQESLSGATAKSRPSTTKADEKELGRLQRKIYWLHLARSKLVMDLVFVSFEVFRLRRGKDTVQSLAGLGAALVSCAKLYERYRSALVAKAL